MHGFQHKRMGIAAGIGVLAFTIVAKAPPELALCVLTLPVGSMLPDIDHDNSKIGSARKKVTTFVKIGVVLGIIGFIVFSYFAGGMVNALMNALYFGVAALLISIVERNKHVKSQLGFITKHRGIMHTLIPPVFMIGATFWTSNVYFDYGLFGLASGYVIHLLGDMATIEGAPILWPLTKSNIRYSSFNTSKNGTAIEVVCNIWCVLFVLAGIYFGLKGGL